MLGARRPPDAWTRRVSIALITLAAWLTVPGHAAAQPGPATVSLTGSGGHLILSLTMGEKSSDYADLSLSDSPHPNGYYSISNVSPGPNGSAPGCEVSRSDLNCTTGQLAGGSFTASFDVSPPYPDGTVTNLVIGYPDDYSEEITFCAPGQNKILERRLVYRTSVVSDQKFGGSCAEVGLAGLRFAPRGSDNGTPGQPIIWDGPGRATTVEQNAGQLSCPSVKLTPADYDYLDCSTPVPSGNPQQSWPVVLPAGSSLKLDEAVLYSPKYLNNPMLEATAVLAGTTLKAPQTTLREIAAGSGYKLTASRLTFEDIPASAVGHQTLQITWKLTSDAGPVTATSSHGVFVTAGTYAKPTAGTPHATTTLFSGPYLSVVLLGSEAHPGAAGQAVRTADIWARFQTRELHVPELDPRTGQVTLLDQSYKYFGNGYPSEVGLWNDFESCPELIGFLTRPQDGHCGDWAWFMEQTLAWQGIGSSDITVGSAPGFNPGPPPYGYPASGHNYMLVGPWRFRNSASPDTTDRAGWLLNPFGWSNRIGVAGGRLTTDSSGFAYNPGGRDIAQGPVQHPLGMFQAGDHQLVEAAGAYYDPSYGLPQRGSHGYPSIRAWEEEAIDGFAVLVYAKPVSAQSQQVYIPAPYWDRTTLSRVCRQYVCRLIASPYFRGAYPPSSGFPKVAGSRVSVPLACSEGAPSCRFAVDLEASAGATADRLREGAAITPALKVRTATGRIIGTRRLTVASGASVTATVGLNPAGRALLRRHSRGLLATLLVTDRGRVVARTPVVLHG